MATNRTWMFALAATISVLAAACGGGSDSPPAAQAPTEPSAPRGWLDTTVPQVDEPIRPTNHLSAAEDRAGDIDADDLMIAAAVDVEAFWEATYSEVYGEPYQPLEGGLWTYAPGTPGDDLPPCPGVTSYDDIAVNAFYCSGVDLIAWDREGLIEPFIEEFGAFTAAVVMAHEFGHAIQARTGDFDTLASVISELQADCFAGAWVAHVVDGGSDTFAADLGELDVALAGLIEIRDAPGSSPDDPSAHGSGFDRVSAFANGLQEGAARCADYRIRAGEPVVVQQIFEADEASSMGDMPTADLLELLVADLEDFFTVLFSSELGAPWTQVDRVRIVAAGEEVSCGGGPLSGDDLYYASYYCVDENAIVVDGEDLVPALEEIGDFALGAELGRLWAFAAQIQQGNEDNTKDAFLNADCLTGLYAGDVYFGLRPHSDVRLSAGDLDEAIISFLAFGGSANDDDIGSPFERTDAFRTGFLGTFADCQRILR